MSIHNGLQRNSVAAGRLLRNGLAHQQRRLKIRALAQQVFDQRVGLQDIPLIICGAIPKSLEGISNRHNRFNHRQTSNDRTNTKTAHRALVNLFGLLLDFDCDCVAIVTLATPNPSKKATRQSSGQHTTTAGRRQASWIAPLQSAVSWP